MQSVMRRVSIMLILALALGACGFQLRGVVNLSFKHLFIQGAPLSISRDLNRTLKDNGIRVVDKANEAELLIDLLSESNEKRILSLGGTGAVREYELNYQVSFRTRIPSNPLWSAAQIVQIRRTFSYADEVLLGKDQEEEALNLDMHKDAVREIMRRLTAIKYSER